MFKNALLFGSLIVCCYGRVGVASTECADPKSSAAVAECLATELRGADANINGLYSQLMAHLDDSGRQALRSEQRAWLRQRDADCDLDSHRLDREEWYRSLLQDYGKTVCVTRYTRQRTSQLDGMLQRALGHPGADKPVDQAATPSHPSTDKSDYRLLSESGRTNGLWYFEVTIEPSSMSGDPTDVWYGCRREHAYAGGLAQVRAPDWRAPEFHGGIALDLNAGKVYVRGEGRWNDGEPGTSGGLTIKLAETYRCGVETTALLKPLLDSGSIHINYGEKPFAYPMPDGYRAFIDGGK